MTAHRERIDPMEKSPGPRAVGVTRSAARIGGKNTAVVAIAGLIVLVAVLAGCGGFGKRGISSSDTIYQHRVHEGETLADIAEQYYGDPGQSDLVARVNHVSDEDLTPGMVLRVPLNDEELSRVKERERARAPYNRALLLVEKGAFLDAVQQFNAALTIDPDFIDASYNLGVTLQKMKSYEKALHHLQHVVDKRPGVARYQFALGNCYFYLERYAKAASAFEACLQADSRHTKALYSLAVCYEKLGQRDKAKASWQLYLRLDDSSAWADEARKRLQKMD